MDESAVTQLNHVTTAPLWNVLSSLIQSDGWNAKGAELDTRFKSVLNDISGSVMMPHNSRVPSLILEYC